MACIVDLKCENPKCSNIWEYDKGTMMNDVSPDTMCPKCGSKKWYKKFNVGATDTAVGKLGKGSTSFDNEHVYHPSPLAPNVKGKRIK